MPLTLVLCVLLLTPSVAAAQAEPDPLSLVQQGRRLSQDGKQAEALRLFRQVLATSPDLFEAHLAAGMALDLEGEYREARTHLTRAIALAPEEAKRTALNAMAVSHAFEGDAAAAATFYQQVFDADMAADRAAAAAGTANALGRVYLETGDTANAARWYRTGYETASRLPKAPGSQHDLWEFRWVHAQGRIAARDGRADEARRHVEAARELVSARPSLKDEGPTLAYLAGYVALHLDDARLAAAELAKTDQDDPFVLMLQAQALEKLGQPAKARGLWEQVLTRHGHSLQNAFARPAARKALQ